MAIEEEDDAGGIPEWVVTFGDMMSLLLTFFIMLVSLSEIKQDEQYQAMVESFRQQFGYDTSTMSLAPGTAKARNSRLAKLSTLGRAKRYDLMRGGDKVAAPVGDHPRVRLIRMGDRTASGSVIIFDDDSTRLIEQHMIDLQLLAGEIGGKPQKIEVRGHTSGKPLADDAEYADHWDLAYRRAKEVMRFMVEDLGIEPARIRLSVAGKYEPFTIEADRDEQKLNPRVEVFMLDQVVRDLSGTNSQRESQFSTDDGIAPDSTDEAESPSATETPDVETTETSG